MPKRNVTVSIDEEAYRRGRIWAAENETTLSAFVSCCIEHLADLQVAHCEVDSIHPQRNSMVELTLAIERLSSQLSASAYNENTHCATSPSDTNRQSQSLMPDALQRTAEKEAKK